MIHRIASLIIKEILAVLKDPKTRMVLIIPPLIQLFIFAFAATLDVENVSIAIINRDCGEKSIELVQRFTSVKTFSKIEFLDRMEDITPFLDNQKGVMVVSIDDHFSENILKGQTAPLQLILDGRKSNTAQIVAGYASRIIDQYSVDIAKDIGIDLRDIELFPRNWFNPNLIYYWYNIPCLSAILTMLVGLVVTALTVAREREMGTFDQLLVSPLSPFEILIGKMLPAVIIALSESFIIVFFGIFVFQVPYTSFIFPFYFALLIFVLSIVGIGLFISSICSTQQQAILGTFTFMSPSVLLSGYATPIENMPEWLQYVTYLIPLRYMLVVAKGSFLKAMPLSDVLSNIWPLAIIAFCTLALSSWLFQRRIE